MRSAWCSTIDQTGYTTAVPSASSIRKPESFKSTWTAATWAIGIGCTRFPPATFRRCVFTAGPAPRCATVLGTPAGRPGFRHAAHSRRKLFVAKPPDRDVEKIAAVAPHHPSQPVHELGQSGVRNEILLENIGIAETVLEVLHRVVHLLIAGYEAGIGRHRLVAGNTRVEPWLEPLLQRPADAPAEAARLREVDDEPLDRVVTVGQECRQRPGVRCGGGALPNKRRLPEVAGRGHREPPPAHTRRPRAHGLPPAVA